MYYNSVMVGSSGKQLWKGLWHVSNGVGENCDLQHIMHVTCLVLLYDSACKEYLLSVYLDSNYCIRLLSSRDFDCDLVPLL